MSTVSMIAGILTLTACAHPAENKTPNPTSNVHKPPYDYKPLMGFQPVLPAQNFGLQQISSYVFKFVNAPWGKANPHVIETWGNDTAFDATYVAPNGSGKSFTLMETKTDENAPPSIGTPWRSFRKKGKTLYENDVPGYGTGIAMVNEGVLYLVSSYTASTNGLKLTQLQQILESLSLRVRAAPDMIKSQTFGFATAPTAVPFAALIPKTIPFRWKIRTAVGADVTSFGVRKEYQHMGRLTLVYERGNTQLKLLESLGMKYVNPSVVKAENGVDIELNNGQKAVFVDGGSGVTFIDGGSSNRRLITWATKSGINVTVLGSKDLAKNDLVAVANSLIEAKSLKNST